MAVFVKNPERFTDFLLDVAVMYLPVLILSHENEILSTTSQSCNALQCTTSNKDQRVQIYLRIYKIFGICPYIFDMYGYIT